MLGAAAGALLFSQVYALFGHGVRSIAMSLMFLYPLIGGTLVYFLLDALSPQVAGHKRFRLLANLYNSGIATACIGTLLQGVFDIAGTASSWTVLYKAVGWGMIASSAALFVWMLWNKRG